MRCISDVRRSRTTFSWGFTTPLRISVVLRQLASKIDFWGDSEEITLRNSDLHPEKSRSALHVLNNSNDSNNSNNNNNNNNNNNSEKSASLGFGSFTSRLVGHENMDPCSQSHI